MAKFVTVEILRNIDLPASIAGGAALALNRVQVTVPESGHNRRPRNRCFCCFIPVQNSREEQRRTSQSPKGPRDLTHPSVPSSAGSPLASM